MSQQAVPEAEPRNPLANPWLWLVTGLTFLLVLWLSLARYQGFNFQSFDLGAISQAIWNLSQGNYPIYTHEGIPINRLAGHVELFYFLLAPVYRIFPSVGTLLVVQAALFVSGAIPAYLFGNRRLGSTWAAIAVVVIYLFYPVAQTAVLFEFHGDTLAMPLLLWAINALDQRRWLPYTIWLILALSCKFYVAVPVAVMGALLWWREGSRAGFITFAASTAWFFFAFGIIRPTFAPAQEAEEARATIASYFSYYFGQYDQIISTAPLRLTNAALVYTPAILFGWRAWPWLIAASSVIVPVLLSSGPGPSYHYIFHHYALAVPFLLAAIVYGIESVKKAQDAAASEGRRRSGFSWRFSLGLTVAVTLLLNALTVDTPLNPAFYLSEAGSGLGWTETGYKTQTRDTMRAEWLANEVPEDASVAADRLSAIRLVNRETLYLSKPSESTLTAVLPTSDYVVTDALNDYSLSTSADGDSVGGILAEANVVRTMLTQTDWRLVAARDGLLLFGRGQPGLAQAVEIAGMPDGTAHTFDDKIGMRGCEMTPMSAGTYQMVCDWVALQDLGEEPRFVAVTQLDGVENARIPHLPTMSLLPTTEWPESRLVQERFDFTVPDDLAPGIYSLTVAWYDSSDAAGSATDERSRLGEPVVIGEIGVP